MLARAIVRATIAPLLQDARPSATQISQLLRGHHADVLEQRDVWLRVRGADLYEGWCHMGYVELQARPSAGSVPAAWSEERRMALGCTVRTLSGPVISLPVGAMLEADEPVITGLAMNHRGRARYFAQSPELLAQRAVELFAGTPYQWGGVTPWGADCSGFVQTMFALHGVQLPRDAWQQGEFGVSTSGDADDLRSADLLFFSDRDDGKLTHAAIALGGGRVVHCSLANGGYGINMLGANDPVSESLRSTFRFAKRIFE